MTASCERFIELELAEAEGQLPSESDVAFRAEHAVSCAACACEARALALLSMGEDEPAHFKTSPAERARTIDAVLAAVDLPDFEMGEGDEPVAEAAPQVAQVLPFARRVRKPAMWATSLAAAAAALLLVVHGLGPSPVAGPAPLARVLLSSGGALSAGVAAVEGQELSATDGEVSLALGGDIVILLDPGSRARLSKLQASGIELSLESGRVHASVKPHTTGPKLAVLTRDGRVDVTGTLFSVEVGSGASELRVLRGSVKVSAPGHKASQVEAFKAQRLGTDEIRALTAAEQESESAALRRIALLEIAEASTLEVRSSPTGAKVSLDGESMGVTPLSAEVKTGHRHLLVASAETTREEWIDLHAGNTETRDFDLSPKVVGAQVQVPETDRPIAKHPAVPTHLPAAELQRRAWSLRQSQDWSASAASYHELLAAYPNAADEAWVTYGELLVDHLGDPKGALKSCERYLDRKDWGGMAAEAMTCRIHALQALGRKVDERAAIEKFLARFPAAVQASQLQRRLEQLR